MTPPITSGPAAGINVRVLQWWDYVVFVALSGAIFTAVVLFARHWISLDEWRTLPASMTILSLLAANNLFVHQYRWFSILLMQRPRELPVPSGLRVAAVTTFVPRAEPLDMLEETVRAMVAMDYLHDTWVLDEGDDPAVRALCARYGARHFSRREFAKYLTADGPYQRRTKHGNYNAWLSEIGFAGYDIIAAFDPDHVPRPHFLTRVLGYFDDPTVGYVQAAQVYYNQSASFIARGAAEETYAYYSSTQMACYAIGYPIVTGCHQTHRATALRDVGGFAAHDADDLLITMLYRAARWNGVYVPEVLAEGITPVDWTGYLTQQRRWARSVLDVKFRAYPKYVGRLRPSERVLGLLHGTYYFSGLTVLVMIIVLTTLLVTGAQPSLLTRALIPRVSVLAAALFAASLYMQRFFLRPRTEAGVHWRAAVLQIAKWPWLLLGLIDAIRGTKKPYSVTLKVQTEGRPLMLTLPHLCVASVVSGAWVVGTSLHGPAEPDVQLAAAIVVAVSLGVAWTEQWRYPAPYERRVWEKRGGAEVRRPRSQQ